MFIKSIHACSVESEEGTYSMAMKPDLFAEKEPKHWDSLSGIANRRIETGFIHVIAFWEENTLLKYTLVVVDCRAQTILFSE